MSRAATWLYNTSVYGPDDLPEHGHHQLGGYEVASKQVQLISWLSCHGHGTAQACLMTGRWLTKTLNVATLKGFLLARSV